MIWFCRAHIVRDHSSITSSCFWFFLGPSTHLFDDVILERSLTIKKYWIVVKESNLVVETALCMKHNKWIIALEISTNYWEKYEWCIEFRNQLIFHWAFSSAVSLFSHHYRSLFHFVLHQRVHLELHGNY